jgi:hypothetical protein
MPFKSLADKKVQKKPFFKDFLLKNGKNSKKSFKFPIKDAGENQKSATESFEIASEYLPEPVNCL